MINFKYVRWKNFLSTGNQPTEIQLDRNPTTLIIGENGAGKSTILDALCFGLFGKPFRNISKNQLINSINNGGAMVEVEFSIGSVQYKVIRGIKPNKFEIYQNDKLLKTKQKTSKDGLVFFELDQRDFLDENNQEITVVSDITVFRIFDNTVLKDNLVELTLDFEIENGFDRSFLVDFVFLDEDENITYDVEDFSINTGDLDYSSTRSIVIETSPEFLNSIKVRVDVVLSPSTTTAFSRDPPKANPIDFNISTSLMKPKVLALDNSFLKAVS